MAAAVAAGVALTAGCTVPPISRDQAERKFRDTFTNMPVDEVKLSEIPGIYEVWSQGKIFYYSPEEDVMMFGELYTTGGVSLTQQKIAAYQVQRSGDIPEDVGVRVGEGATEVIAFLDPHCGHCAQAQSWFEERSFSGVSLRVVFMGLEEKSRGYDLATQVVCAPPHLRREALRQMFEGPVAGADTKSRRLLACAKAPAQLKAQSELARTMGVDGTPTFFVKGQMVMGFDPARLESLVSG